jgi:multiple sugar transport system permease protein
MVDRRTKILFLSPAIVYLLLLTLYPFIYSLYLSTTRSNLARLDQTEFVGLGNYAELIATPLFHKAIINTFLITIASITVELVLAFVVARIFFFIRNLTANNLLRTIYILPMMITPVVSGLLWTYILNPTLGIANYILVSLGLEPYTWFAKATSALISVVLVNSWQWSPFLMLLLLAGLTSIAKELYEAAAIDGAGYFDVFRHIEIPSLRGIILVGALFRIIDNLRLFDVVYVTTRGGPGDATEVVSMYTYREMFQFFNIGYGSSAAVVVFIMGLILANILFRFIRQREA